MTLSLHTQTLTINGAAYRVNSTLIDEALGGVPEMSFNIEMDANPGAAVPVLDDEIVLTQVCDGSRTWRGRIESVTVSRANNYTIHRVRALGEERAAGLVRQLRTIDGGPMRDVIRDVWSRALPSVDLSELGTGGPALEPTVMTYTSLAEFMELVERQTGRVWTLRNNVLRVFHPANIAARPVKLVAQTDFEQGSINYETRMDAVNIARQQAWFRRTITVSPALAVGIRCYDSLPLPTGLPQEQDGWELEKAFADRGEASDVRGAVQQSPLFAPFRFPPWHNPTQEPSPGTPLDEVEVRVTADMIELRPALKWSPTPRVQLIYRKLAWVERRDQESISLYGPREGAPLPHDGDGGVEEAGRRLALYLEGHALPSVKLTGSLLRADVVPGNVLQATVPDVGERTYLVRRVRRAVVGTELEVTVEAETVGVQAASASAAPPYRGRQSLPIMEVLRRVENLERGPLNPRTPGGDLALQVGVLGETEAVVVPPIQWTCEVEYDSIATQVFINAPWRRWRASSTFTATLEAFVETNWPAWSPSVEFEATATSVAFIETTWRWDAATEGQALTSAVVLADWSWQPALALTVNIEVEKQVEWPVWRASIAADAIILAEVDVTWPAWSTTAASSSFVLAEVETLWPSWTGTATSADVPGEEVQTLWPVWSAEVSGDVIGDAQITASWPAWSNQCEAIVSVGLNVEQEDDVDLP